MKTISNKRRNIFIFFISLLCSVCIFLILLFTINSKAHMVKPLNLSQKQLLILSNYMYLEDSYELLPITKQLDSYKKDGSYDKSLINLPASGIKDSHMIEMFEDIEKDPILSDLVAVDSLDTDIRAVCFVDKSQVDVPGAEAVLVFLGTKALDEAWLDCLEGAYYEDTRLQLEAMSFYEKVSMKYTITNVAGHSKGGNLSQYVTILGHDNIRKCVSFNGQGFSNLFINKYQQYIDLNAHKITSIVSYKEPINTMLNAISPNKLIIKTDEHVDILSSHVSSYLYDKSFFDTNGNYVADCLTSHTSTIKYFDKLCDSIANNLDAKYIQSASLKVAPALGTLIPMLQDAMAREDVSLLKGFYEEVKKYMENDYENSLSEKDIAALNQYSLNYN